MAAEDISFGHLEGDPEERVIVSRMLVEQINISCPDIEQERIILPVYAQKRILESTGQAYSLQFMFEDLGWVIEANLYGISPDGNENYVRLMVDGYYEPKPEQPPPAIFDKYTEMLINAGIEREKWDSSFDSVELTNEVLGLFSVIKSQKSEN